MKKLLFLFLSLIILSCKKDADFTAEVDNNLIAAVKELPGSDEQRLAFAILLNASEKNALIEEKLNGLTKLDELTEEQKQLLSSLLKNLPKNLYEDTKVRDKFMESFGNKWVKEASVLLGENFIRENLVTVSNIPPVDTIEPGDGVQKTCKCSRSSDWCNSTTEGDCVSADCAKGSACGFLLAYDCDGWCNKMLILL